MNPGLLSVAERKIAFCITCQMSVGSPLQAAAHYRSREHLNRRLQRGLPVTMTQDLTMTQDQPPANRDFINECLRRGIPLPQLNAPQPGMLLLFVLPLLFIQYNLPDLSLQVRLGLPKAHSACLSQARCPCCCRVISNKSLQ